MSRLQQKSWQEAIWALPSLRQRSVQVSTFDNNIAANSCAKALRWQESWLLVHGFQLHILDSSSVGQVYGVQSRQGSDVVSYNIAISAISAVTSLSEPIIGKSHSWAVAINCLSALHQRAIESTMVSYGAVMAACADLWMVCTFLLTEVWQSASMAVNNAACKALSDAGLWKDVLHVLLSAMRQRLAADGLSHTTAINACGRGMAWQQSAELLRKLRQTYGQINAITHVAAVTALSSKGSSQNWKLAVAVSSQIPTINAVCHAIVTVLDKVSRWECALLRFESLAERNLRGPSRTKSYNAAIHACKSGSQWSLAVAWFQEVGQLKADAISCGTTISACAQGSQWQAAVLCLDPILLRGPNRRLKHQVAYSAALAACEDEHWPCAINLLRDLKEHGMVDLVACHSSIAACGKGLRWQEAMHLALPALPALPLQQRQQSQQRLKPLRPGTATLNSVMAACDRSSQWQEPLVLLAQMQGMRFEPHSVSYNTVISALADNGYWRTAANLLTTCAKSRLQLDVITFGGSIRACVRGGQWERGLMFFEQCDHAVQNNVISSNAAISSCVTACHQGALWQTAVLHLEALHRCMQHPTVVSFNTAMSACGQVLKWKEPLVILANIFSRKAEVDQVTYNALIEATGAAKQWHKTMLFLDQLTRFTQLKLCNVAPWSFFAAISACAKCVQWSWALFILDQAEQLHGAQVLDAYEAVLGALIPVGEWQQSLNLCSRLKRCKLSVNTLCHKALVEVLETSGKLRLTVPFLADLELQQVAQMAKIPQEVA